MNKELEFNMNDDHMRLLISDLKKKASIIYDGGGKAKITKQHKLDTGNECVNIVAL